MDGKSYENCCNQSILGVKNSIFFCCSNSILLLTDECCELLQIVWVRLMLSKSLAMLFTRMGKIPSFLIPWKSLILMFQEEAFTMAVSYRECEKRLQLFQSSTNFYHLLKRIFFFFIESFPSFGCSNCSKSVQCKIRTRICHISARRRWNHQRGKLQNQEWTRAHS